MSASVGKNRAHFNWAEVKWLLGDKKQIFAFDETNPDFKLKINGVTTDSRAIEIGNLFIALRGEKFDGHDYLPQIKEGGATAAVVERKSEVDIPQFVVPNALEALGALASIYLKRAELVAHIAVTGSYGKTSTRVLIHAALSQKFETLTSQGNFNNEIGLPMTLLQLERQHQIALVEMGMRGRGQIEYLSKIAVPNVGVITNIGPQHIELLGSVEEIAAAKAELLENLPSDGLAILPADSPFLSFLQSKTPCRSVTFGASADADYRVTNIETRDDGSVAFELHDAKGITHKIELPLPGAHNAVNAAAAFAVASEMGVESEAIVRGLESAELPGARMRVLKLDNGATIIDDCYNAGPDSMRAALQTLLDFPGSGRRVAILGSMKELGAHSEAEHAKIGRLAGQFVEVLVGVGGDTRPLLNAAVAAAQEVENEMVVSWCDDAAKAASRVGEWVRPSDVVLVKGSRSVGLEVVVEAVLQL